MTKVVPEHVNTQQYKAYISKVKADFAVIRGYFEATAAQPQNHLRSSAIKGLIDFAPQLGRRA